MSAVNYNYGRAVKKRIEYAPATLTINGFIVTNPTAEQYRQQKENWLPVVKKPHPEKVGVQYCQDGWREWDGEIVPIWKEEQIVTPEPIHRKWTKMKLKVGLANAGWLTQIEQILSAVEFAPNYSAWQAMNDADYIEEYYPTETQWNTTLDGVATAIGKTRSEIDAFLDTITADGGLGSEG